MDADRQGEKGLNREWTQIDANQKSTADAHGFTRTIKQRCAWPRILVVSVSIRVHPRFNSSDPFGARALSALIRGSIRGQRVGQDFGGVQSNATGAVFDLVPATGAGCGDNDFVRG
jgi:hypothetical protein